MKPESEIVKQIRNYEEIFWINKNVNLEKNLNDSVLKNCVDAAEKRLERFSPLIAKLFPETKISNGIIESPLVCISKMKNKIENIFENCLNGNLYLKCDSNLPISGSVKARGGIHEVLEHTEKLALENGILKNIQDDYLKLASQEASKFFSKYKIQVGSTGNLGLSIGIMSASLGFNAIVHMSSDAKQWKKDLLRQKGATVIEYDGDYGEAVKNGRTESDRDPFSYFVDDEKSKSLFSGYAVASLRLKKQLAENKIIVDEEHPLFVYIPCGVGGAPGGIIYGLKLLFGNNVHCFIVEPTHAPCMVLGLETGLLNEICVQDIGLDGKTKADGLAVGRCSSFIGKIFENILDGAITISDDKISAYQKMLWESENIYIEPSSCAGFYGLKFVEKYMQKKNLTNKIKETTHIIWATGGSMVPQEIRKSELEFR